MLNALHCHRWARTMRAGHRTAFTLALGLLSVVTLGGFRLADGRTTPSWQLGSERGIENGFPASTNPLWNRLKKCDVSYDPEAHLYRISVVPEVKALDAKSVRTSGFMTPLDGLNKTKHFLLTKRAPICRSCPTPGTPNEAVEVRATEAIDWRTGILAVKGQFKLINDGRNGFFFALLDAEQAS